jgi:cytochrome c oxidase subunit 2
VKNVASIKESAMKLKTGRLGLVAALLLSGVAMAATPADQPRRINVVASKFQFDPPQITVKKGETVVIVLTSSDVTHGLKIPDLNVSETVKKGGESEITITPEKVGTFEGKCAHFCGKGHGSMKFAVNVVE